MTTPRLGAPELVSGQAVPETTVNEQIRYLESGAGHFIFKDRDLVIPPGSPADGDCYLVAASPTGAWSGKAGKITFYLNTAWVFITAIEGLTAWINDENVFVGYDGAAWQTLSSPSGSYLSLTGGTLSGDLIVPDEAYDATAWNGNLEVPTKNAVRDKIEALTGATLPTESFILACSDETTALTSGTAKVTFRMPYAFTVTAVYASLTTAQTSGSIFTVDINEAGTSILSTKLTIDNTEDDSATAATAAVISDTALAARAKITVDIDQIGDGTAKGLKVAIVGHQ
jgi:hypothetical protein